MNQLSLEHADCLIRKDNFGVTEIHNICNGSVQEIAWGLSDWANAFALVGILGFFALMTFGIIWLGFAIINDRF